MKDADLALKVHRLLDELLAEQFEAKDPERGKIGIRTEVGHARRERDGNNGNDGNA